MVAIVCAMALAILAARPVAAATPASSPADTGLTFARFQEQVAALTVDPARGARVPAFELRRDAATMRFESGTVHLCKPIAGHTCAVVYVGRGTLAFRPPTEVERAQLVRLEGRDSVLETFTAAALVFGDSTLRELEALAAFGALEPGEPARTAATEHARFLAGADPARREVSGLIAHSILEGGTDGMFAAMFVRREGKPVFLEIAPRLAEAVRYLKHTGQRGQGIAERYRRELVTQFPRGDQLAADPAGDLTPSLDAVQYTVRARIEDDLDFSATADLELISTAESQRWLSFYLDEKLVVDSATVDGLPVSFFKGKDSESLWIRTDRPLERGQKLALLLRYHGEPLERTEDWITFHAIWSASLWYPRHDFRDHARFDLTFQVPRHFQFACVGRRLPDPAPGLSRWAVERPVRNASFNLGFFKELEIKDPRIPPVKVQMSTEAHRALAATLGEMGIASGSGMEKQVGADVANSLAFFSRLLGPPPDSTMTATEIPDDHGQAFPGLIHLSWSTFQRTRSSGGDQLFRAHEVAHQWWGIGVATKTYHDQWLSEAFAHYCGLWYAQASLGDNKRFFAMLDEWRREILTNRKFLLGSGQATGPIWLGGRTEGRGSEGDYSLVIYKKGAWVLHMLRNMLLDLDTMSDDRFARMLRDFYGSHRDRAASTADFQFLAQQHAGEDLGWFFDQWIYGTDIPTYRFAWKTVPAGDGSFKTRCRIEQSNVPETFRMYVPIRIEFADKRYSRTRVLVKGPVTEVEVPVAMEPKKVVLNDLASVLCEVENRDW